MEVVLAVAVIVGVIAYVNYRLASTNLDREEIEEAEKVAKNFADSNDFRKM